MRTWKTGLGALAIVVGLWGCMGGSQTSDEVGTSRIAIGVDIDDDIVDSGLGSLRYTIDQVACDGAALEDPLQVIRDVDIESPMLADGLAGPNGRHRMADQFVVVPAGCYDIRVDVLDEDVPSLECGPAFARNVEVKDGETTELLVVLQCGASPSSSGGLDVTTSVNGAPGIENLEFLPSKFLFQCEMVEICATARDLDGDDLEFVWTSDLGLWSTFEVIRHERAAGTSQLPGSITECVQAVAQNPADYQLSVTVYDLFTVGSEIMRAEEWYAQNGQENVVSRDSLEFPLHVGTDLDLYCLDAQDELQRLPGARIFEIPQGCDTLTPAEYYCDPDLIGFETTCPNGVFDPTTVYSEC